MRRSLSTGDLVKRRDSTVDFSFLESIEHLKCLNNELNSPNKSNYALSTVHRRIFQNRGKYLYSNRQLYRDLSTIISNPVLKALVARYTGPDANGFFRLLTYAFELLERLGDPYEVLAAVESTIHHAESRAMLMRSNNISASTSHLDYIVNDGTLKNKIK